MKKKHIISSIISLYKWGGEFSWFKDFENKYLNISFIDIGNNKMEGTVTALMVDFIKPMSIIFLTKRLVREQSRFAIHPDAGWFEYFRDLNLDEIMNLKLQFVQHARFIIDAAFYEVTNDN